MSRLPLPETVFFRAPAGFVAAVTTLAERDCSTLSDVVRRAVARLLREEGLAIEPGRPQSRTSEALPPSP